MKCNRADCDVFIGEYLGTISNVNVFGIVYPKNFYGHNCTRCKGQIDVPKRYDGKCFYVSKLDVIKHLDELEIISELL